MPRAMLRAMLAGMVNLTFSNFFVFFCLFYFAAPHSEARWAEVSDSGVVSTKDDATIEVNSDGTHTLSHDSVIEIRNESGRSLYGMRKLAYNSRASELKNVIAQTFLGSETINVEKSFIEDKPLASSAEGFDEIRQLSVAYPEVGVGAKLRLKYEKRVTEVPLDGAFSFFIRYGDEMPETASTTLIRSKLPLFIELHDPRKKLEVKEERDGDLYIVRVNLKEPIFLALTEEENTRVPPNSMTWLLISSHKTPSDLGKIVAPIYEQRLLQALPKSFLAIVAEAKSKKTPVDQINHVTSRLADEVRYLGDWRATKGGHIPRTLDVIASTRFGDCKDLSLSTAAMLRQLGYDANLSWIERGRVPSPFPSLAYDGAFNHAIVRAKKGDWLFWIDPTNIASFAQGTFEDIAGRPALTIYATKAELARTPELKSQDSWVRKHVTHTFDRDGDAKVEAVATVSGNFSVPLTAASRQISKESVEHYIAKSLVDDNYITSRVFKPFDLSSRIVSPYTFKADLKVRNMCVTTNAGLALPLLAPSLDKIVDLETDTRAGDLILDSPHRANSLKEILNAKVVGASSLDCKVSSRWFDASRVVRTLGKNVQIQTDFISKVARIGIDELRSKEFSAVQRKMQKCFSRSAVVFKKY